MGKRLSALLISALLLSIGVRAVAQTVTNVRATQKGNDIEVSYFLNEAATNVHLCVSTDGGKTFSAPLRMVSGAVGNVTSGYHTILWNVQLEYGSLVGDEIVFKVIADQKRQTSASASSSSRPVENKTKQKNTRFVFELGGTFGASLLDIDSSAEGRSSMCKGKMFSIYGNIGILIKHTSICLFFEQVALPYTYLDPGGFSYRLQQSSLSSEGYFGVDFRQYFSNIIYYGARCGVKTAHWELDDRNHFLIQGQLGFSPFKWMTINAHVGYPVVEMGVTVNIPNIFRK